MSAASQHSAKHSVWRNPDGIALVLLPTVA